MVFSLLSSSNNVEMAKRGVRIFVSDDYQYELEDNHVMSILIWVEVDNHT